MKPRKTKRSQRTRKRRGGNNTKKICNTGVGARSSGKHTPKQFLKAMQSRKDFVDECPTFTESLSCDSCKKRNELWSKNYVKQQIAEKQKKEYKMSDSMNRRIKRYQQKCETCSKKRKKECNLEEYVVFTGADYC